MQVLFLSSETAFSGQLLVLTQDMHYISQYSMMALALLLEASSSTAASMKH